MQLIDLFLWALAIIFLFANPIAGVVYIIILICLYRELAKTKKKQEEDKKHQELIKAIENRKED